MRSFFRRRPTRDEIELLYRLHGPRLLVFARSLMGSRHAAEDVLHQVFMKLLEQDSLPEDPKPYLFRSVRNGALNMLRDRVREADIAEIEPWFEAPGQDAAAEASLRKELLLLPTEQRQALVLHIWGGLSFEEIGDVLDISSNTAASRYRYALEKLRTRMRPEDIRYAGN